MIRLKGVETEAGTRNASLTETDRAALSLRYDRILAGDRGTGRWPALNLTVNARTLLAALLPRRAVLVDGAIRSTRLLALALLHLVYPALCSG